MRVKQAGIKSAPVRTMKIQLLKNVILGPNQDGEKDEIYEVPRHMGTMLISHGQAKETKEGDELEHDETPAGEKETFGILTVEKPTSRDPRPQRRGRSRGESAASESNEG